MKNLVTITHVETRKIVARKVVMATSILSRMRGLMFRNEIEKDEGIILEPCNSIHTFFMKFPIDVVFINKKNKIIKIYKSLPPWRLTPIVWGSKKVLEVASNQFPSEIKIGDTMEFSCLN